MTDHIQVADPLRTGGFSSELWVPLPMSRTNWNDSTMTGRLQETAVWGSCEFHLAFQ